MKRVIFICYICKKSYPIYPSWLKQRKTCSRECGNKHKSLIQSGKNNPFFGKKHSSETINKIKIKNKGKRYSPNTEFKKGMVSLNKGKFLEKTLDKNIDNWRERRRFRQQIQKRVLERDCYTCQECGNKRNLQVDHIQSWAEYVELRFNIENCRTLCAGCHYQITYGKPMPKTVRSWGQNMSKGGIQYV